MTHLSIRPSLAFGTLAIAAALAVAGCEGQRKAEERSQTAAPGKDERREEKKEDAPSSAAEADAAKAMPIFAEQGEAKEDGDDAPAATATVAAPERVAAQEQRRNAEQDERKPTPDETAAAERYFTHYGVNPTIETRENPLSTFGVDVDTAAFVMARSYLDRGELPPEDAIRVEEVVNYFDYHYAPPERSEFSMHAEVVPSPHRKGYHVLHLGLKGKEIAAEQRPDANLVFVIDVSGSMGSQGRLQLVKDSLRLLVEQLRPTDRVGVVVYGSNARVVLPPTAGSDRGTILAAIDGLATEGSTNVEAGLRLGYELAGKQARGAGINRVVLCSDGVANAGATTAEAILGTVEQHAAEGITITTIGVGMGSYNDTLMEQLADKGNGNYAYVDDQDEARRIFVDHLTGTLQVIAKDVKLQIELDPAAVARYRLLGYENRTMSREDFHDDRKDSGELGAGHTVTALYEIKLQPGEHAKLGTLRVRYKTPRSETSELLERDLPSSLVRSAWAEAAPPTQLSVVAAAYAEKLRGSYWVRNLGWSEIQGLYDGIDAELRSQAEVRELGRLIDAATGLDRRTDKFEADLPLARMDFDRVPVLQ